jgi:phage-related protein
MRLGAKLFSKAGSIFTQIAAIIEQIYEPVGKQALGASAGIGALVGGAMGGAESMWENAERADRSDFDATDASADVIMDSVGGAIQGGAAGIGATIGTITPT